MKRRRLSAVLVVALLLPLSGCPGAVSIKYGVWLFTITQIGNPNPYTLGVVLLQHGLSTQAPGGYPGSFGVFGGPVTWQRSGSSVSFLNNVGPGYSYTGTADSSTSMSGTWQEVGNSSYGGTWSAEWDPEP